MCDEKEMDGKDISIGLIVDSVSEVIIIPDGDIAPPPSIQKVTNRYIKGIGRTADEVKLLLDCKTLLNEEEEVTELTNL